MKGIGWLRSHEKGTWKHFIIPSPCIFRVQLNDLHHWAPKQAASVSRQGWLKITLWNDIKLVKRFSAYGIGQGVPYFTPAANFSPLLSSFFQFSWGESSIQPLQVRLDRPSGEDGKDTLAWSPTYHSSSAPLSQEQVQNVILGCSFFWVFFSINMLSFCCCCIFLLSSSYYKFPWQKAAWSCPRPTVFSVIVPLRSGAFGFPC